jgi:3-deoxy-D-manno-octulosonic-acid transferase
MGTSIGLALYLAAAAQRGAGAGVVLPAPPRGRPAVWLHAPQAGIVLAAMVALACRLAAVRPQLGLILTHPPGYPPDPHVLPAGSLALQALPDDPSLMARAITTWRPGAILLGDGPLAPALVHAAEEAGLHALLVGARTPRIDPSWSALPGLQRTLLRRLRRILVTDAEAERAFRRAGARPWRLEVAGPLAICAGPLAHNWAERDALAARIGARPVWLAVAVPEAEEGLVLAAQQAAQRLAHRLLLILVPADPSRGPALAAAAAVLGLRAARRGAEQEPGDEDQLYIADTEGELGLWYRLSPVSFMAGTVSGGASAAEAGGRDPLEPAALGSAVLHGPLTGRRADTYARLASAGACRPLRVALRERPGAASEAAAADALAEAVVAHLAPDRVAAMARAGWDVATAGVDATERAAALVFEALDEAAAARPAGSGP